MNSLRSTMLSRVRLLSPHGYQVPHLDLALPLDRDRPPRLALELVAEQLVRRAADLDPPRRPVRLHAAGRVDSIAPEVVEEALAADHARYHRARIDADPELEAEAADSFVRAHRLEHVERHERERASMVGAWCRNA